MTVQLRRNDYSLDADQAFLKSTFASFCTKEVPLTRSRRAEPLGHDPVLWMQLAQLGGSSLGLPESVGGGGAALVDQVLVAEELGRVIAPVPFNEHSVAGRLVARTHQPDVASMLAEIADGTRIVTLAPDTAGKSAHQLVPAGAISADVAALDGDELVLVTAAEPRPLVPNQGSTPLAWWNLRDKQMRRTVLAEGPRARELFADACRELKLLSAGALVGLGEAALSLGVEVAKERRTLGVAIGALQGVAFPLADVAILLAGAKNLTRKAAWMLDREPDRRPELVSMAFAYAARAANTAVTTAVHVHGGMGVSLEADITLYFRRAKGWSIPIGDADSEVLAIGNHLLSAR